MSVVEQLEQNEFFNYKVVIFVAIERSNLDWKWLNKISSMFLWMIIIVTCKVERNITVIVIKVLFYSNKPWNTRSFQSIFIILSWHCELPKYGI